MTTTAEPKARPIIFSGPMVRAILDGRKTQTRRLIKPQPVDTGDGWYEWRSGGNSVFWHAPTWQQEAGTAPIDKHCPYGKPGDRLWVRETSAIGFGDDAELVVDYFADGQRRVFEIDSTPKEFAAMTWINDGRRSSAQMPRWASRLTLELTEVRVQRLHNISEEDAIAEGCGSPDWPRYYGDEPVFSAREVFQRLWNDINGKRAHWNSNPWVWALSFTVVRP